MSVETRKQILGMKISKSRKLADFAAKNNRVVQAQACNALADRYLEKLKKLLV